MLNKKGLIEAIKNNDIYVDGLNLDNCESELGENHVYVRLGPELLVYEGDGLDFKNKSQTKKIVIPEEGYRLEPNVLYLGRTLEYTETRNFVPIINGLPGLAYPGMTVHVTAGFGDNGFCGTWTLEIVTDNTNTVLKSGEKIGIIQYHKLIGDGDIKYEGKYLGQIDATASRSFHESELVDNNSKSKKMVKKVGDINVNK